MRFATCLADRLWVMLDREYARVWLLLMLLDCINSSRFLEQSFRGAGLRSGDTGGKGPNNQWAHAEYIKNPVNK